MLTEVARRVVAEWLEERALPEMVRRRVPPQNLSELSDVLAVIGPRRAGKTYFMFQLVGDLIQSGVRKDEVLFVDLEDYRLVDFTAADFEQLLVAFNHLTGHPPRYLFLDEVQRLPHWSRVVRTLHNSGRYRVVISGSSSQLLSREIATELRGRYRDILMLPFSFAEFLDARGVNYTRAALHTAARGRILKAFDEYLREGGFPDVVRRSSAIEQRQLLQTYYQTVFYRDVMERHGIRATHLLELVMRYCLDTRGDLFSISAFEKRLKAHGLEGSKRTISNYLQYLEQAFFVILAEKFAYAPRKRLMNPKKVYLLDTGFAQLSTAFSPNLGKALENVAAIELYRRQQEFFYYRGRREVDFVVCQSAKPSAAIQACWQLDERNRDREIAGLVEAASELGPLDALILTYDQDEEVEVAGRRVRCVPVWKWLLGEA